MTKNRRQKTAIRHVQTTAGVPYMVARRQTLDVAPPTTSRVEILPPRPGWTRPIMCRLWEETAAEHGPLIALTISRGEGWWALDDLARAVAGALQDDRPAEERGLWLDLGGKYTFTKREHLDGIVAALDGAGALSRLTVREVPDAANCTHATCRRHRGEPPLPKQAVSVPSPERPAQSLVPTLSLAEVMEQHPQLGSSGIGVHDARRKSLAERRAELVEERAALVQGEERVMQGVAWLMENVLPIKTCRVGSYGAKHVMERAPGAITGSYVTNGEFIAAALIAGYPHKFIPGSLNVVFGMSARDMKRMAQAGRIRNR